MKDYIIITPAGYFLTPGGCQKGPINQSLSILLSFHPSFCPFVLMGVFFGIESLVFSKYGNSARNPYEVDMLMCMTKIFFAKDFLP